MIVSIVLTCCLAVCATAILSYISMAVMIGPWIESTVILLATLALYAWRANQQQRSRALVLVTAGASIGGILATGLGFAFPTLFFLDPNQFNLWLAQPLHFALIVGGLAITAGALGLIVADLLEDKLITQEQLPFPIAELAHKMITAQDNIQKARQLGAGFITSLLYSIIQKASGFTQSISISKVHVVLQYFQLPALAIPALELPMLWAIGFVTGHVIALPLAVGIISKICITAPLYTIYFPHIKHTDFLFAFASGMMIYGTILSFFDLPRIVTDLYKKKGPRIHLPTHTLIAMAAVLVACSAFFFFFNMSVWYQLFVIGATIICIYQLSLIGGKFGLAPMGRYATFVMFPSIILFGYNPIQATIVATFVEVAGGVAVDVLFGRKLAQLSGVTQVRRYQWLGLLVSAVSAGIIFFLLITQLGLGSEHLLAQRAQSRALTLSVQSFNFFALLAGALFGSLLKDLKVNPIMVLGGIFMPIDWSLILVLGGLSTYLVTDKESHYPFWSGVFAANSLWMLSKIFF